LDDQAKTMILIALGANLPSHAGSPAQTVEASLRALAHFGVKTIAVSSFYVTPAWPDPSDPSFVNAVAHIQTSLPPAELLTVLHNTETAFGRARSVRNAPRTLDLDLLDYDGRVEGGLVVLPHPRIADRGFVLVPLADVAPDWRHPIDGRSVRELVNNLPPAESTLARLSAR